MSGSGVIIIGRKCTMRGKSLEKWKQGKKGLYKTVPWRSEERRTMSRVILS